MWGKVTSEVGEDRERQLSTRFFKPAIDKGAQFLRHVNTVESARAVIRAILNNHPLPLQIQEELVDKGMEFPRTGAGQEIHRALNEHAGKLESRIKELKIELQNAEERETQQELEEEVRASQGMLVSVREESMQLQTRYQAQRDYTRQKTDTLFQKLYDLLAKLWAWFFPAPLVLGMEFRAPRA